MNLLLPFVSAPLLAASDRGCRLQIVGAGLRARNARGLMRTRSSPSARDVRHPNVVWRRYVVSQRCRKYFRHNSQKPIVPTRIAAATAPWLAFLRAAASTQRLAVSQSAAGSLEDMGPNASRGDACAADERTDANRTQTQTGPPVSRNAIVKSFARGLQVVKTLARDTRRSRSTKSPNARS